MFQIVSLPLEILMSAEMFLRVEISNLSIVGLHISIGLYAIDKETGQDTVNTLNSDSTVGL